MLNKSTLNRYRKKKDEIKEEKRIDNSLASMLWFRGRTDTMVQVPYKEILQECKLGPRNGRWNSMFANVRSGL